MTLDFSISFLAMRRAVKASEATVAQCDCGHYVSPDELRGEWQDSFDPERCPNCEAEKLKHADWLRAYYGNSEP